jgi:hypothetical protein
MEKTNTELGGKGARTRPLTPSARLLNELRDPWLPLAHLICSVTSGHYRRFRHDKEPKEAGRILFLAARQADPKAREFIAVLSAGLK